MNDDARDFFAHGGLEDDVGGYTGSSNEICAAWMPTLTSAAGKSTSLRSELSATTKSASGSVNSRSCAPEASDELPDYLDDWDPEWVDHAAAQLFVDAATRDEARRKSASHARQRLRTLAGLSPRWDEDWFVVADGRSFRTVRSPDDALALVAPCQELRCDCFSVGLADDDHGTVWLDLRTGSFREGHEWPDDHPLLKRPLSREFQAGV